MQKEPSAWVWHYKSLSAGPLRLRALIWPSTGRFDNTACILWPIEEIKPKSQYTIKARSLEAMLPAIIFICDVYVSMPEQNTTRKGRAYKKLCMRMLWKRNTARVRGGRYLTARLFAKGSKAGHLPENCLPGAAEHLGACIGSLTPPKAGQYLSPDSNLSFYRRPEVPWPIQAQPIQATTRERYLLRPLSYGYLWRARTSDCHQYAIVACNLVTTMTCVINNLYGRRPVWSMTCVIDNLYGRRPVGSMTCEVDDLRGW